MHEYAHRDGERGDESKTLHIIRKGGGRGTKGRETDRLTPLRDESRQQNSPQYIELRTQHI